MALFNLKPEKKEEEGNLYTNIFEKKDEPKEKTEESDIISGVFEKKKEDAPSTTNKENVLGPIPQLEQKLIGAFDPSKRNLKMIRAVFITLLALSLLTVGFFYAELNPEFDLLSGLRGPNTTQQFNNSEAELLSAQTKINQKNYLLTHYYLEELSYLADSYAAARNEEIPLQERVSLQNSLLEAYENAQVKWNEPKAVGSIEPALFQAEAKRIFQQDITQLKKEQATPAVAEQIRDYTGSQRLIGNSRLNGFFTKNVDEIKQDLPRDDTQLFALTKEALEILQNDFSHISRIKLSRIQWSTIVSEIERVTKSVDSLYNTGFFEDLGGIQYSGYDFDADTNRIVINGRAKQDDGSTFTLIANLIDALENSEMFSDVDNRSYPKTGSNEDGYISTFRIEFTLNEDQIK